MDLMEFASLAMTVPFKQRGRDVTGWDCWGLVYVAYAQVYGVALPDYLDSYESTKDFFKLKSKITSETAIQWREVPGPRPGDMVVILRRSVPIHLGLWLPIGRVLHAESGVGTAHQAPHEFNIEGFYEHPAVHV